jgi:hypothetical protein
MGKTKQNASFSKSIKFYFSESTEKQATAVALFIIRKNLKANNLHK